jgi:hypothetical protein
MGERKPGLSRSEGDYSPAVTVAPKAAVVAAAAVAMTVVTYAPAAWAQINTQQRVVGTNEQVVVLDGAEVVNTAKDGARAELNIASNVGPGTFKGRKTTVHIKGRVVNVAEGEGKVSRVNIASRQADQ